VIDTGQDVDLPRIRVHVRSVAVSVFGAPAGCA
jgi:hypothetical protein